MAGVSSRTHTNNVINCLTHGSSSKRRKSDEDDKHFDCFSGSKKRKVSEEPFLIPENAKVISIDDHDEGSEQCDEKKFEGVFDVKKDVKSDESAEFDAKDGNFVDEKCGWTLENLITIHSDEEHSVGSDSDDDDEEEEEEEDDDDVKQGEKSGGSFESADKDIFFVDLDDSDESDEEHCVGSDSDSESDDDHDHDVKDGAKSGGSGEFSDKDNFFVDLHDSDESDEEHCFDSDESEENETSDDDFRVDELNEISDNDDDSSSGSPHNDGKEKEKKKGGRKYYNVAEELVREANDKHSGISEMNNKEVKDKSPSSVNNDEVEHSDYGSVATSTTFEKKGSSSNKNDTTKKQRAKSVENVSDNDVNVAKAKERAKPNEIVNSRDDVNVTKAKCKSQVKAKDNAKAKPNESVDVADSGEGKEHVKGLDVWGVSLVQTKQEMMKETRKQKVVENKGRDHKGIANIRIEKKKESIDNNGLIQSIKNTHFMRKELLLAECYWDRKNTMKNDSTVFEFKEDGVDQRDTQPPPVSVETPPSVWSLIKVEKVQKTKEEEENEVLWNELDTILRESDVVSMIGNLGTNEATEIKSGSPSSRCEHDTFLDEEIGVYCKLCGAVITEIKYISPLVVDRFSCEGSRRKASFDAVNVSLFDGSQFNDKDSETNFSRNEGTVWDLIPDLKQTLYPHQQEGFEFIWKNFEGSVKLQKLKNADPCSEGGCIISHAPGTGKTRLTIVFLKAYLKAFPKCLPIIVAPASILLTWEDEFKKWDIGVPFHNLSNPELSGKEHADAVETFDRSNTQHNIHETRMAKLISWFKETSILGISYNLFGKKCQYKEKQENVKERKGNCDMRKVLLKAPGLLVLDEGHTPRNQRSHIWKVLSKIQAQKRIILSGTPFQNNFWELYSTLSLVKPSFPNTIPHELKSFCHKSSKKWSCEPVSGNTIRDPSDDQIRKFKFLMDPFVHVHKGAILENKLPGLRDSLVTLKAGSLQNEILKSIKRSKNTLFNFECKIALTSVHPSLFLQCALSKEEEAALDKDQLEKLRLNPYEGVKTKFLFEFVRLCDAFHEKVLVFSQFQAPLQLIKYQLTSAFKWSEGKEVLFMSGKDPPKVKQSVIHSFNDANCQAKVLLASTKACSEGISLVGASRVVLLDVVWNPSVERQAISRAYRIGQNRVVYTYHLLAEGTTEEEKYGKQAEKDRLSELVFSEKNATENEDESKSCDMNFEDRVLDQMTQHENLKDMFVKCVVLRKERDVV